MLKICLTFELVCGLLLLIVDFKNSLVSQANKYINFLSINKLSAIYLQLNQNEYFLLPTVSVKTDNC